MFLSKRQNGFYYLFITDEETGKRSMVSCRTKYKSEALRFLANFKSGLKDQKRCRPIQVFHLSDLQREVMNYVSQNLRRTTCLIYNRVLKDLLRIIENKPLKLISINDIEKFRSQRQREVNHTTVNIELSTMKAIFNIAVRFEWIKSNPCKQVKKIEIPEKEKLSFDEIQLKLIIENAKSDLMKRIIRFALLTGCRLNEILNIQWRDIDFITETLSIRNKENFRTKTGKQRQIPLSNGLVELLNEMNALSSGRNVHSLSDQSQYIFSLRYGARMRIDYVSKEFKKILRSLNFPEKFHFHCLRHTFITNLIKAGVNINYVKEIAGHSDIHTTMNYIHILTEDLRAAVNKINLV